MSTIKAAGEVKPLGPRCFYVNALNSARKRPCTNCADVGRIIAGSLESGKVSVDDSAYVAFEWWTAVGRDDRTVTFRVISDKDIDEVVKRVRIRMKETRREYTNDLKRTIEALERRYSGKPVLGKARASAGVNADYARLLNFDPFEYRPATPCEVMAWFTTHVGDELCFLDRTELMEVLTEYV